ncbi:MAG TPA: LemA family protein [Flavisolibacter sp.]|nr:LemA family protein [Flavisolibacter sp.]
MRRTSPILLIVLGLVVILIFWGCSGYNGLVSQDENVKKVWNDVQTQYQRRNDLIPNLVNTVKGEANFERGTLTDVINARARATSMQINPDNLTNENVEKFQQAQAQLSGALSRLLVTVEQYPTLRANDAFRNLQAELAGTENRISVARRDFNGAVQDYNTRVRRFPTNLVAGVMGFHPRTGFTADQGAQNAPRVDFGNQQTQPAPSVNLDSTKK